MEMNETLSRLRFDGCEEELQRPKEQDTSDAAAAANRTTEDGRAVINYFCCGFYYRRRRETSDISSELQQTHRENEYEIKSTK